MYHPRNRMAQYIFIMAVIVFISVSLAAISSPAVRQSRGKTCTLSPLEMPLTPARLPGYTELDESTGLHVTGTMQMIDIKTYYLEVTGKVNNPLRLTIDDLRCMPRVQARPKLVCPGFFEDVANWAGTPLKHILQMAKLRPDAKTIDLISADGYSMTVPIKIALADKNFLAYEWEGKYLPELHGFPLRAIFPGMEGNRWVKWLIKIDVR